MNATIIPLGLCQCGCGQTPSIAKRTNRSRGEVKGQPHRFVHGHRAASRKRENNIWWNGGRRDSDGYVEIRQPEHPHANKSGYIREQNLIAEKALGKVLPRQAVVHHVNEVKSDNRNSNLVICQDHKYHMLLHVRMRALKACGNPNFRKCQRCKEWSHESQMIRDTKSNYRHEVCPSQLRKVAA